MYFPIGAPSVYSQDLPTKPRDADGVLQDGLETTRKGNNGELISGVGSDSDTTNSTSASDTLRSNSSDRLNRQDDAGTGRYDGLVGMQSSRSGQIFATITFDSITIWQAKVY